MEWEVILGITLGLLGGMTLGIPFGANLAVKRAKDYVDQFSENRVQGLLDEIENQDRTISELQKQRDLYKEKAEVK